MASTKLQPYSLDELLSIRVETRLIRPAELNGRLPLLTCAERVYAVLHTIQELDREVFYTLHLDAKNRLMSCEEVSKGCLTWSVVHPREVYKAAVHQSAAGIIIAHNHPSGDPTPSPQDLAITKRLQAAGELLGIPLIDSVVIGHGCYQSLRSGYGRAPKALELQ